MRQLFFVYGCEIIGQITYNLKTMIDIVYEVEKLLKERDLYYSRSIEAENARRKLEKLVNQKNEECEALRVQISELESDLSIERVKYMTQEDIVDNLDKELSEKNYEIENYKKTCNAMQMEIDRLQKDIQEYVIGMADVRTLRMELEEQNRILKTEIENYKKKKESLEKKTSSNLHDSLSVRKFIYTRIKNTTKEESKENDIDKLISKLDKLEEIILKNASRNIYNISIGKADQLNGLLESGSQVIHTKSK